MKKDVGGTESIVEIGGATSQQTAVWKEYDYTATSNQTTFSGSDDNSNTLSYVPNFIQVFLNGILLDPATDYTATTGSSVVLASGATAGDLVQISTFVKVLGPGDTIINEFTGNNSTVNFTLTANPGTEDNTMVFLDGVYQEKATYSVSGTTLTFSTAPATGVSIEVAIGSRNVTTSDIDDLSITGDLTVGGEAIITGDIQGDLRGATLFKGQAGEALLKGEVVYISGISGNTTVVSKADADDSAKMPAFGIVAADASINTSVTVYTFGRLSGLNTSSYSEGDELFVSTTAGALTNTAPTGESAAIQKIAKVTRSDNAAGSIFIMGAGRSNAVPNLDSGDIFYGNGSNQAITTTLDTSIVPENTNLYHTTERVQDVTGGQFVTNGTHTGISFAYDDAGDGAIDATVSLASFDTDDLSEGSTNLYYTDARADARIALQVGANLDLSSKDTDDLAEGVTNLYYTDARARGSISVTDSGGDGSLTYNSGTGVITYTGPSASEVRAHFSAGTGVTLSSGQISIGQAVETNSDVQFNDVTVDGNLIVGGTTTTVNSTTVTVDDPVFTLGGDSAPASDDNKDRGIEFRWHDGSNAKVGFFGFDDSTGYLTFIPDATNTSEVFSGTQGDIQATNFRGNLIGNVTGTVSDISNHTTDDLSEGSTNLYYTTARWDTKMAAADTDDLSEGSTNLYYTSARFDTAFSAKTTDNLTEGSTNLYYTTARWDTKMAAADTDDLSEGATNLYFTEERVDDRVASLLTAGTGITLTYDDANNTLTIAGSAQYGDSDVETYMSSGVSTPVVSNTDVNGTLNVSGTVSLDGTANELRFYEGANYVGFEAPALSGDQIWVLPDSDGTAGYALKTDGAGNLSWGLAGDNAFKTIAVSGQSDVVADSTADTLTLAAGTGIAITTNASTDTITITNNAVGDNAFGNIAVSGQTTVAADSTNDTLTLVGQNGVSITTDASTDTVTIDGRTSYTTFTTDLFTTANATTTDFVLSVTPSSEDNLIVFVEGVYQNKNSYSLSSSTLTLSGAPASGEEVVVHIVSDIISGQALVRNNFTGDNSTTDFTLTIAPMNANNTFVYFDGVYQEKSEYSVSGTTLSFNTAPALNDSIEVIIPKATEINQPATGSIDDIAMFDNTAVIGSSLTSTTLATTSQSTIATHSATTYRTIKYLVQCTQGTDYHSTEINLIHDGTTAYITEYGTLFDNASLGTFDATISGGNIVLQMTPGSATSMTVKVVSTAIPV